MKAKKPQTTSDLSRLSEDKLYELGYEIGYEGADVSRFREELQKTENDKRLAFKNGYMVGKVRAKKEYTND